MAGTPLPSSCCIIDVPLPLQPPARRHGGTASLPPAPESLQSAEARDWAALPRDILLDIFLRLGPREVMLGAEFACKPWRSVALEEPVLWRRIGT
jgi:hypothetical protein